MRGGDDGAGLLGEKRDGGVGRTPPSIAVEPPEARPAASARSSAGPERGCRGRRGRAPAAPERECTQALDELRRRPRTTPRTRQSRSSAQTGAGVDEDGVSSKRRRPGVSKREARLPLRELRPLAGLLQAGLLALDLARVAGEEALALERDARFGIGLDERPGDPVTQRAGLAGDAAAVQPGAEIEPSLEPGDASGASATVRSASRGKYSSSGRPLIQVDPSPGRRITRATEVLRLPVPRYWAIWLTLSCSSESHSERLRLCAS